METFLIILMGIFSLYIGVLFIGMSTDGPQFKLTKPSSDFWRMAAVWAVLLAFAACFALIPIVTGAVVIVGAIVWGTMRFFNPSY